MELKKAKLPIDTKHFSQEFKEKLLENLTAKADLDGLLDGILLKSENWQALNLLLEKYKGEIQTIYIDPPFNKENEADYLYKVGYKDSTWITMLINSIGLGKKLMNDKGSIFVRCDYNGNMYVRLLMNEIFGSYRNEIILSKSAKVTEQINRYHSAHDSLLFYTKSDKYDFTTATKKRENPEWRGMHLPGIRWSPIPNEYVPLFSERNLIEKNGKFSTRARIILGKELLPPDNRHWAISQKDIFELEKTAGIILGENGEPQTKEPEFQKLTDNWTDWVGYSSIWGFSTENHEKILYRIIFTSSIKESDIILDFFLGSGTTTAVAQKLKRKWTGVEMGGHFETVVLPRMKKVLFYDKSGISKELKEYKGGGFFKYHYLEQYEDTLHNIEFAQEKKGKDLFERLSEEGKTEYLMKYILKFETEGSPSILDIKQFENPFEYKLKIVSSGKGEEIVNVDLVETFNYLIGLKINKYKFVQENARKYVFVFGERNSRKTAIVWRPTKDIDMAKDKEIIDKSLNKYNPDEIFINGDSFVKGYKVIESEFKTLIRV